MVGGSIGTDILHKILIIAGGNLKLIGFKTSEVCLYSVLN